MPIVNLINTVLTRFFDALFIPLRALGPFWAMVIVSLVTGVIMLVIFGKVSNQTAIRHVRDQIRGNLIAVRLFQDDIGLLFNIQSRILRFTLTYMRYSLVPMLIMIVPVMLILIQLNLRYSVRPLKAGEQAVVKVKTRDAASVLAGVQLEAPVNVEIETPPVRIQSKREVAWRIRAKEAGAGDLTVRLGDDAVAKRVIVDGAWRAVSPRRTGQSAYDLLLYPGEPALPSSSKIESIQINYPARESSVLGFDVHWMILFFVLSVAFGFALKGPFGVEV